MAKNWFSQIDEMDGIVHFDKDPFEQGVFSSSPSLNFIFGNTHLLPFGYTVIFWGQFKGGKSIIVKDIMGQLHKNDPEALIFNFNTEMREEVQMNQRVADEFGIDLSRYRARSSNKPEDVFDFIEVEVPKICEKGGKIKLIAIDSISDILGRRFLNATTVSTQQRGDHAATVQDGLKRIKSIIRKYGIALILTAQARAEQDPIEQMRGRTIKMDGAYYLKHFAEYFVYVGKDENKDSRVDLFGKNYENESMKDMDGKSEILAHKIKVIMKDSTVGITGRTGEFTLHKYLGIINTWEEVLTLGINRTVLSRPNNRSYVLSDYPEKGKESKWTSFDDVAIAVKNNDDLQKEIMRRIRLRDIDLHKSGKAQDEAPRNLEEADSITD
jgi:hypothetical protein